MSYGLYDGDLIFYKKVPFFNLELMKISSYYKRRREIVSLSPSFSPQMYTNFIVRQDYPYLNKEIFYANNVTFGGRAYDGEKYKPLSIEIERSKPDIYLYERLGSQFQNQTSLKTSFSTMRRAEHIRLSLDGKTVWPDFEKQFRKDSNAFGIIFHDYNLGEVENAFEYVSNLPNEIIKNTGGRRVGMKFPVQLNTEEDLLKWASLSPVNDYFFLQYNGILTTTNAEQLKEIRKNSTTLMQTRINVTKNQNYEEFISTGIIQLFENMLDLRREQIAFPLIYDKDFFVDSRWLNVLKLIKLFSNHIYQNITDKDYYQRVAPYESLYSYLKTLTKEHVIYGSILPVQMVKETLQFVRENNYNLFVDFYEYCGEKKK